MNVPLYDLLAEAGPFVANALTALPPASRAAVAEAHAAGGWCELRIGLMNNAATVRLMLVNLDGQAVELSRVDHVPN